MSLPRRAYWPRQPRHFGHWLTGAILGRLGIGVEWSPPGHAELAGSGAVLDFLPAETSAVVLGCGFHLADAIVSYPRIRPYAVRGRLSAEKLGLPPGAVLADLGLLADILVTSVAPGPLLGIVADGEDQWVMDFCQRHPDQLVLIDSRAPRDLPRAASPPPRPTRPTSHGTTAPMPTLRPAAARPRTP